MPLEGQWRRANTPLRHLTRRERWVAAIATLAVTGAVVLLIALTAGNSRPAPGPGCIRATVPHVMGAEQLNACGQRARRVCAQHASDSDPGSLAIAESCRKARI
jgi:hypothetical protein